MGGETGLDDRIEKPVVMALLLAHALCMQDGKDALTLASMNGHTSVIQALRTAGAT